MKGLKTLPQMPWVGYRMAQDEREWFKRNRDGEWLPFTSEDQAFYVDQYPKIFTAKTPAKN